MECEYCPGFRRKIADSTRSQLKRHMIEKHQDKIMVCTGSATCSEQWEYVGLTAEAEDRGTRPIKITSDTEATY